MRHIMTFLAFLASALLAQAQPSIKVQVPNLVSVDEQFNISFTISGENAPSSFEWQPGSDFKLVWGPQKGTSTSVSIVNGQHSRTSQTTYTYILMPTKPGKFTIAPATAIIKGERLTSTAASIEVVSGGQSASSGASSSASQQGSGQQGQTGSVSSEDIFLKLNLSKTKAVVGETLNATLKLYQRVNIAGFDDARFPTFSGFWSQEEHAPSNIEFVRENVGNTIYNTAVIRGWSLIPQKAGDIVIDPAELVCLVNVRTQRPSSGSLFDSFFQDDYQTVRKRVTTPAVTVHVSSLPAGAPASFSGGVGNFTMEAVLSKDTLSAHEASSLIVTVSGKGNIKLLEAPKLSFPPDFEAYDVKTTDAPGKRVFEYPFIPRSHGEFVLGPVEFSYYDVSKSRYVTLSSPSLPVRVAKAAGSSSSDDSGHMFTPAAPSNRKDVRDVGSDIRYIATSMPSLSRKGWFFAGSALFWIIAVLLAVAALACGFAFRSVAAMRADVAGSRRRSATKNARRRLSKAGEYLSRDLYTAFYEELHKALLGFISDKLSMDAADMSKENISARLASRGVPDGLVSDFVALLDACEFARYSPSSGHEAMDAHYESAVNAISAIDENMNRKRKSSVAVAPVLALLLATGPSLNAAAPADSLWNAGVQAYSDERYSDAAALWQQVLDSGVESSDIWFNIGNALFKQDELAGSILAWERALKLDPSNSSARYNLDFANSRVQDKIESVPEFFFVSWLRSCCWLLPSGAWAVLCLVFLAFFLACGVFFFLSGTRAGRKAGFFVGIAMLLLCILSAAFAFWQKADYADDSAAIVVSAVSAAKSSPGGSSTVDLFVLHEGTKVTILDSVGDWLDVELADGRQGWIPAKDLERI